MTSELLLKQIAEVVSKIKAAKDGVIYFVALIKLQNSDDPKWDFVLCADWVKQNITVEDVEFVLKLLRESMKDDTSVFSQIVTLMPETYFCQKFSAALIREHAENNSVIYNLELDNNPKLSCVTIVESNLEHFPFKKSEEKQEKVEDQAF